MHNTAVSVNVKINAPIANGTAIGALCIRTARLSYMYDSYRPGPVCMAHLYHPYNLLFERYLLSPDTSKKIRMHGPPVGLYRTYKSIGAS